MGESLGPVAWGAHAAEPPQPVQHDEGVQAQARQKAPAEIQLEPPGVLHLVFPHHVVPIGVVQRRGRPRPQAQGFHPRGVRLVPLGNARSRPPRRLLTINIIPGTL